MERSGGDPAASCFPSPQLSPVGSQDHSQTMGASRVGVSGAAAGQVANTEQQCEAEPPRPPGARARGPAFLRVLLSLPHPGRPSCANLAIVPGQSCLRLPCGLSLSMRSLSPPLSETLPSAPSRPWGDGKTLAARLPATFSSHLTPPTSCPCLQEQWKDRSLGRPHQCPTTASFLSGRHSLSSCRGRCHGARSAAWTGPREGLSSPSRSLHSEGTHVPAGRRHSFTPAPFSRAAPPPEPVGIHRAARPEDHPLPLGSRPGCWGPGVVLRYSSAYRRVPVARTLTALTPHFTADLCHPCQEGHAPGRKCSREEHQSASLSLFLSLKRNEIRSLGRRKEYICKAVWAGASHPSRGDGE